MKIGTKVLLWKFIHYKKKKKKKITRSIYNKGQNLSIVA